MKKEIRKKVIKLRDSLDKSSKVNYDNLILNEILEDKNIKKSKVIFAFLSFGSEIDTFSIIERLIERRHTICVPKLYGKEMKAIKISSLDNLEKTKYALEPKTGEEIAPRDIDAIIVPGVAFNRKGNRIGYGGGYYDKFMINTDKDCLKIAISYELQVLETIPVDEWDIEVDALITEKGKYNFTRK